MTKSLVIPVEHMNDSEGGILFQLQKKTIFPRTMKMKWVVIQTKAKAA